LAIEYFGTDDPDEMQKLLSDMDKFTETTELIKQKSEGNTYMVASSGNFQSSYLANRSELWIVDNALVLDPMVE